MSTPKSVVAFGDSDIRAREARRLIGAIIRNHEIGQLLTHRARAVAIRHGYSRWHKYRSDPHEAAEFGIRRATVGTLRL